MRHSSDAIIINSEQIHCNDGALVLPTKFWEVVSRDFLENSFSEKLEKTKKTKQKIIKNIRTRFLFLLKS